MDSCLNDETPKKRTLIEEKTRKTPLKTPKNFARYLLLSNNQSFTPSPSQTFGNQQRVVRNPFESQLHERLHLPVISSPSLFNCLTPKKFEWSIDEISQLHPINMKPHETQFVEDLDPQTEAEAQAAITSFFKEHKIVPSPINCSLRRQKIFLKSEDLHILNSTSYLSTACATAEYSTKPQVVETSSQTDVTFPPILPKEVEDLLKKYHFIDNSNPSSDLNNDGIDNCEKELDTSMMDVSTLRRKLFILRPETPTDELNGNNTQRLELSPAPGTPELTRCYDDKSGVTQTNESYGSDMFGELSPIKPCTPVSISYDVSMLSEYGNDKTPSRRQICKRFKKKGKNLSESFCFFSNELNNDDPLSETFDRPKRFARSDSGFDDKEENSKFADFMQ